MRIAHDSALIGLVQVVRKPRRFLFPSPVPIMCLALELSRVVTAFVDDRGQAEGRKDAGCLAHLHYFVHDTIFFFRKVD